jgi:hypothetical protein
MQRAERKKDVFLDVFTSMMTERMQKNQRRRTAIVPILNITYCLFILPIQIQDIGRVGLMWSTACIWFGYSICYQVLALYYGVV